MDATWDQWTWFIASWLFHCSWMVSIVGGLFWMATLWLRSGTADSRYRLGVISLALVAVCVPLAAGFALQSQPVRTVQTTHAVSPDRDTAALVKNNSAERASAVPMARTSDNVELQQEANFGEAGSAVSTTLMPSTGAVVEANANSTVVSLWIGRWVALGYLTGVVTMLLRMLLAGTTCRQLIANASPADKSVLVIANRAAHRLKMKSLPAIKVSQRVVVPFIAGIFQPTILLPVALISNLSAAELQAIILHELVHFRRHDHWILVLQRVIETCLFFHPIVWVISRYAERQREMSCDDQVLGVGISATTYGQTLIQVAEFSITGKKLATVVSATGSKPSFLKQRIERIIKTESLSIASYRRPRTALGRPVSFAVVFAALTMWAVFAIYSSASTAEAIFEAGNLANSSLVNERQDSELPVTVAETFPTIEGTVRDEQGNALAGVTVTMQEHVQHAPGKKYWIAGEKWTPKNRLSELKKTKTDEQGRFRFSDIPVPLHHSYVDQVWPVTIVATHAELAFCWKHILHADEPIELKMLRASPVNFSVYSEVGTPISGLKAELIGCLEWRDWQKQNRYDNPARGIQYGLRTFENFGRQVHVDPGSNEVTVSQLPKNMVAAVQIFCDNHVPMICYVSNLTHKQRAKLERDNRNIGFTSRGAAAAQLPFVSPARVGVTAKVDVTLMLAAANKTSLENVVVTTLNDEPIKSSDANGTVILEGVNPLEPMELVVRPPLKTELQSRRVTLLPEEIAAGAPIKVDLIPGQLLSGTVLNKDTQQGVAGAVIDFAATMTSESDSYLTTRSDVNGLYQMIVPELDGVVSLNRLDGYQSRNARLVISREDSPRKIVFEMEKYRSKANRVCRIHIVDDQKVPVTGAKARIFQISKVGSYSRIDSVRSGSEGYVDIPASKLFWGHSEFVMLVRNDKQRTGAIYRFNQPESIKTWEDFEQHIRRLATGIPNDAPVMSAEIVLKPLFRIEGTIVDQKTLKPLAGAIVRLRQRIKYQESRGGPFIHSSVVTNRDGKYSLDGFANTEKTIFASAKGYLSSGNGNGTPIAAQGDSVTRHLFVHHDERGGLKSLVEMQSGNLLVSAKTRQVKVVDYESGDPVVGAKFEWTVDADGKQIVVSTATSDQDGNVELVGVPESSELKWRAQCDGYHSFGWRPIWENTKSVELLSESNYDRLSKIGELLLPDVTGLTDLQAFRRLARSFERTKSWSRSPSGDDPMTHTISAMKQHPVSLYRSSIEKFAFASDGAVDPNAQFEALKWCLANDSIWPRSMRSKNKEKIIARLAGFSKHPEIDSVFGYMRSMKESETFFKDVAKTHPSRSVRGQAVYQLSFLAPGSSELSLFPGAIWNASSSIKSKIASQHRRRDYLEQILREFADVKQGNSTLGEVAKRNLANLDQFGIGGVPTNLSIFTTKKQRLHLHDLRGRYTLIHYWNGRGEYPEALVPWTQDNDQVQLVTVVYGTQEKVAELTTDWRSPVVVDVPSSPRIFLGSSRKTLAGWAKMSGSTLIDPEGKILFTELPQDELYRFLKKNELLTK